MIFYDVCYFQQQQKIQNYTYMILMTLMSSLHHRHLDHLTKNGRLRFEEIYKMAKLI